MDSEQVVEEDGLILEPHLSRLSLYLHQEQCASAQHFHPVDYGDTLPCLGMLGSTIEHHRH